MKKIFIVSLSVFSVTLLFLGVYNFAFKSNPRNPTVDEKLREAAKEEADALFEENRSQAGPVEAVSDMPVYGAAIIGENAIAFFRDGALRKFSYGGGGEETLIGDLPGKMLEHRWAPDRHAALALFERNGERRWHLVDLTNHSVTPLKKGLTAPTWSNLSEKIFYFYDNGNGTMSIDSAKPDGSDWEEICQSPALRSPISRSVPGTALLSFWGRPSAFEEASLYTVPVTGGSPKPIFEGKFGADFLWAPDGGKVLVSNTIGRGGAEVRLGIANQNGGEFHTLLAPTFVSKTVWSKDGKTLYYALPLSLPENVVLPDDYFGQSLMTNDSFWKMDVSSGQSERLLLPGEVMEEFDGTDFFLDAEEHFLFFTNRRDDRLYRIRLD